MADDETIGLDEAYAVRTPDDVRRLYAKWAATYESEFVDKRSYRYPQAIAEIFNEYVPRDAIANVIDIGTGTGLTGLYLSALRSEIVIDGVDISPEMLAQARRKARNDGSSVYRQLFERDLTAAVFGTNTPYHALICSGTFTHGHLGPSAFANLLPLVNEGGWFVIGVNNEHYLGENFEESLRQLVVQGLISDPDVKKIDVYEDGSVHRGDMARVLIFTKS